MRYHALAESGLSEHNLLHDVGRGEIDADYARADFTRELRQGLGAPHAEGNSRFGGGIASVPYDYFSARVVQMTRHGAPHVPKPDESDLVSCEGPVHVRAHYSTSGVGALQTSIDSQA
jgi:hypothetical protein